MAWVCTMANGVYGYIGGGRGRCKGTMLRVRGVGVQYYWLNQMISLPYCTPFILILMVLLSLSPWMIMGASILESSSCDCSCVVLILTNIGVGQKL